jgi:hypothetical protein
VLATATAVAMPVAHIALCAAAIPAVAATTTTLTAVTR